MYEHACAASGFLAARSDAECPGGAEWEANPRGTAIRLGLLALTQPLFLYVGFQVRRVRIPMLAPRAAPTRPLMLLARPCAGAAHARPAPLADAGGGRLARGQMCLRRAQEEAAAAASDEQGELARVGVIRREYGVRDAACPISTG